MLQYGLLLLFGVNGCCILLLLHCGLLEKQGTPDVRVKIAETADVRLTTDGSNKSKQGRGRGRSGTGRGRGSKSNDSLRLSSSSTSSLSNGHADNTSHKVLLLLDRSISGYIISYIFFVTVMLISIVCRHGDYTRLIDYKDALIHHSKNGIPLR